jgi:hypothetical protein
MTLSFPPSFFGLHLYPGAEVIGPQIGTSVPLEPNNVAWTAGDTLEEPHYPTFAMTGERFAITQNTLPSNRLSGMREVDYYGSGISLGFRPDFETNYNLCNVYVGCGGSLQPPTWRSLTGAYGTYTQLKYSPMGHSIQEGGTLFTVGPSYNGDHHPYYLFDLEGGSMQYAPLTGTFIVSGLQANAVRSITEMQASGGIEVSAGKGGSGLRFTQKDDVTTINTIQAENIFGANNSLGVGQIDASVRANVPVASARGGWDTGTLSASTSAVLNGLSAGIVPPVEVPTLVYSGTAGSTQLHYGFTAVTPGGQETPIGNNVYINSASAPGGGNTVTITCTLAIQNGWPAGTTVNVYNNGPTNRLIGNCPYGGTVVDDGSVTAITAPPTYNATSSPIVGGLLLGLNGSLAALPSSTSTTPDAYFGRGASGTWYVGATKGGHDGSIRAASATFDSTVTVGGNNVCQSNGTNCPSAPPIASSSTNGISHPDNSTIVVNGSGVISTKGYTGACAATTTLTVVNGVITGCS